MISTAEQILQIWDAGERDWQVIADRVGVKVGTVHATVYAAGRLQQSGKATLVFELWDQGQRDLDYIAWKSGIQKATVLAYLKASGRVKPRFRKVPLVKEPEPESVP